MLEAVLELLVRPHDHIEGLLVLLLTVNEVLEAGARVLNISPGAALTFLPNEFVALSILQIHFLLLLERDVKLGVQATRGVSRRTSTRSGKRFLFLPKCLLNCLLLFLGA